MRIKKIILPFFNIVYFFLTSTTSVIVFALAHPNADGTPRTSGYPGSATGTGAFAGAQESAKLLFSIINTATGIVVALAFLYFFFNLGRYILKAGDDQEKARKGMIWGLIAVVVLTSMWGLIAFIRTVFGFGDGEATAKKVQVAEVDFTTSSFRKSLERRGGIITRAGYKLYN